MPEFTGLGKVLILAGVVLIGVGGLLLDHVGWRAIFAVCVLFGMVALSLLGWYLPETSQEQHPLR